VVKQENNIFPQICQSKTFQKHVDCSFKQTLVLLDLEKHPLGSCAVITEATELN